jgi:hypothetical protein
MIRREAAAGLGVGRYDWVAVSKWQLEDHIRDRR